MNWKNDPHTCFTETHQHNKLTCPYQYSSRREEQEIPGAAVRWKQIMAVDRNRRLNEKLLNLTFSEVFGALNSRTRGWTPPPATTRFWFSMFSVVNAIIAIPAIYCRVSDFIISISTRMLMPIMLAMRCCWCRVTPANAHNALAPAMMKKKRIKPGLCTEESIHLSPRCPGSIRLN